MKIIELAADTDLGKQRKDNQDTYVCKQLWSDDQALIGVIDGVGGYEGGEVAARIARESIGFYMSTPKGDALSMLKEAVVLANNQIVESREKDEKLSHMCCVLTVAVADAKNQILYFVHVGDTRLYRYRKGVLDKLTKDHSLVGIREDAGTLTEEEAMQHPRRNIILRQVGTEPHRIDDPEFLEFGETEFLPGDALLICSDGLSDMVTKEQMTKVFKEQVKAPAIVTDLIALANVAGGNDNITVVVAKNLSRRKKVVRPESVSTVIPALPVQMQVAPVALIKKSPFPIVGSVILGAIIISTAFWLFAKKTAEIPNLVIASNDAVKAVAIADTGISRSPNKSSQAVSLPSRVDSLMTLISEQKGKELSLDKTGRDTIWLSHAIALGNILRVTGGKNHSITIMPDTMSKTNCAFEIAGAEKIKARKDTIFLKNITIDGFETGIHVDGHVMIRLENVVFRKVKQSVMYSAADSIKSGYLSF